MFAPWSGRGACCPTCPDSLVPANSTSCNAKKYLPETSPSPAWVYTDPVVEESVSTAWTYEDRRLGTSQLGGSSKMRIYSWYCVRWTAIWGFLTKRIIQMCTNGSVRHDRQPWKRGGLLLLATCPVWDSQTRKRGGLHSWPRELPGAV